MNFIKITKFCFSKDNIKKVKRQATEWKNIFTKHMSDPGLVYRIFKELLQHNKKTNNPI